MVLLLFRGDHVKLVPHSTTMEKDTTAPNYKGETQEHLAAFDIYIKLGEGRSLEKVAKAVNRPKATINNWCKRFEWRLRLNEWQEEATARAQEDLKNDYLKDVENMRTFKYTVLNELKKRFEVNHYCGECQTPLLSVNEMISILNVAKTELGEPTNITKNTALNPNNDPFSMLLNKMFPTPPDADATAA